MNCTACCRMASLVVGCLLALAATVMIIYGGVTTYNVDLYDSVAEGSSSGLARFFKCSQIADTRVQSAVAGGFNSSTGDLHDVFLYQCNASRSASLFLFCFTGVLAFFTLLVTISSNCCTKTERFNSYAFPCLLAITFTLCVASISFMDAGTVDVSSTFLPCDSFNQATTNELQVLGFMCVTGGTGPKMEAALKWLTSLIVFYSGCAVEIIAILIVLLANGCCLPAQGRRASDASDPLQQPLYSTKSTFYG